MRNKSAEAEKFHLQKISSRFLLPVPPILANTIVVPFVLRYAYGVEGTLVYMALTVFIGEFISCGVLGLLLFPFFKKVIK